MNLNFDCLRDVLIFTDNELGKEDGFALSNYFASELVPKYSREEITYTLRRLNEAGFISGTTAVPNDIIVETITPNGGSFLNNLKDSENWARIRDLLNKNKATSLPDIAKIADKSKKKMDILL